MKNVKAGKAGLAALMLLAPLLLGGCSSQLVERAPVDLSAEAIVFAQKAPVQDEYAPREAQAMLYFLDEEGMTLVPTVRTITAQGGMHMAEAALRALCEGPADGESAYWPEPGKLYGARAFELSGGVATVNLPARMRALSPEVLYAVRMAITHTLTEFADVAYVNILVDGREEGFDLAASMPMGALSRVHDLDVSSRYLRLDEMRQSAQDAGISRLTTLCFPSEDGRFILPEVRSVTYAALSPIEYLYTVLEEIGKGTDNPLAVDVPAPMKYIEEMPEIVRAQDGAQRAIALRFSEQIDEALSDAGLTRGIYVAMLTDTLMGLVPGMDGMLVSIGGQALTGLAQADTPDGQAVAFEHALATRQHFDGYVASPGRIYLPAREGDKLEAIDCLFPQSLQFDMRCRLWLLTQRLIEIGALGEGLAEADILAVKKQEARILVNLSENFAQAIAQLTRAQERAAVYAMVNTLTEGMDAQRVAFFFEGEQRETLSGELDMRGEFLRNPGMVVTNGDGSVGVF